MRSIRSVLEQLLDQVGKRKLEAPDDAILPYFNIEQEEVDQAEATLIELIEKAERKAYRAGRRDEIMNLPGRYKGRDMFDQVELRRERLKKLREGK